LVSKFNNQSEFIFNTAHDHRMVMAYAMLAFHFKKITLNEVHWVDKSFPNFWDEALKIGLIKLEVN
jgi:5-enolpyruvylshikimate-3-phosphate synthase